jgi:hypothetical protein
MFKTATPKGAEDFGFGVNLKLFLLFIIVEYSKRLPDLSP